KPGKVSGYYKFSSTRAAIQHLEALIDKNGEEVQDYQVAMVIKLPNMQANTNYYKFDLD
ncbi:MAG: hypothetical protein RLZZ206_2864, partial [Cyanobacteriota bacterium]